MQYLNENFIDAINQKKEFRLAMAKIKQEVEEFASEFHDTPTARSQWGHTYFCNYDGGRLIFDLHKPHIHKCEVCGKEFKSELYDGVWTYFYRNQAILTIWKAAGVYAYTKDKKYLEIIKKIMGFYAENYTQFELHNKEKEVFDSYETMKWGCGRILPQGLNESIITIRMIQALEIIKNDIDKDFLDEVYQKLFKEIFLLLKPQVNQIHNIRCWNNCAIGLMGLFFHDEEMIKYAFEGPYNIRRQIREGVTSDGFWYEGSIHYNFFTLEGITPLLLFSKLYDFDFGDLEEQKVKQMFISAYHYAFDNHYLPNPNDGWPSINLKTYSYIYHMATKIYGENSIVGDILKNIENNPLPRTPLPLSKPYYIDNEIAYERLLFNTDLDLTKYNPIPLETKNFIKSNFAILRDGGMNAFVKYGLNGPSHAHPDLIHLEIMYKNYRISRDLSNPGYVARLCSEWHKTSLAHNTVIRNGENVMSTKPGKTLEYQYNHIYCEAKDTYPGVDYRRDVKITANTLKDCFYVIAEEEAIFDYVFHIESEIQIENDYVCEDADLGFEKNGYQHILEAKKVFTKSSAITFNGVMNDVKMRFVLCLNHKELFILKTMDNPVNITRTTFLLREKGKNITFNMKVEMEE
ncbi:MAG: heparinase II/III-family protein [Roseburia sp.]|nr:heparinase II/III-family protein [Anaeroplasma bactoclasticum]MCM1196209.1 heparinase II/III-family protein [Roseburia sp.]MCM1556024.1 heparinase II/III-family protein [Anaeroplasma bactoclasticum]